MARHKRRLKLKQYACRGYLLRNDGKTFRCTIRAARNDIAEKRFRKWKESKLGGNGVDHAWLHTWRGTSIVDIDSDL